MDRTEQQAQLSALAFDASTLTDLMTEIVRLCPVEVAAFELTGDSKAWRDMIAATKRRLTRFGVLPASVLPPDATLTIALNRALEQHRLDIQLAAQRRAQGRPITDNVVDIRCEKRG